MELKSTEERVNELVIQYESIRRSPIVLQELQQQQQQHPQQQGQTNDNDNNNNNTNGDGFFWMLPEIIKQSESQGDTTSDNDNDSNVVVDIPELVDLSNVCKVIQTLQTLLLELHPKLEKFRQRLQDKDPVTGKPRYGEKTQSRVQTLVDKYTIMETNMMIHNNNNNDNNNNQNADGNGKIPITKDFFINLLKRNEQTKEMQIRQTLEQEQLLKQQMEEQKRLEQIKQQEQEAIEQEQRRQQQLQEQQQAEILRQQAEEARQRRRRIQQAEQDWVNSITKGPEGVKQQLKILKESLISDPLEYAVAISSLQTIFQQINAHPEEVKFRRIRRNHEQFQQDIGRHPGGKELLIAAGFELGMIDEIPVYLSKEPDIEKDMDGWSAWFDTLKKTLEILMAEG